MTTTLMKMKPQNGMISLLDNFFDDKIFDWNIDLESTPNPLAHDIIETDDEYVIDYALAGFKKDDVSLNVENNILTVEGERKANDDTNYNKKSTFYGSFKKSFTLPENVNSKKIDASFSDGILSVIIPKDEKLKLSKQIKIK